MKLNTRLLILMATITVANSIWMILFPFNWYIYVPANVPDFGPYNQHFVRDFGCAFLLVGVGLIVGVQWPAYRSASILFALGFYALHALTHIFDTLMGTVGHHHWLVDFPTTYLPAILLSWIARRELVNA